MKHKFEIGDEVQRYNDKGEPMLGTRFIVTSIDDYLGGIDFGGEIHVVYVLENDEHCLDSWKKTGRWYNILYALQKLRDGAKIID